MLPFEMLYYTCNELKIHLNFTVEMLYNLCLYVAFEDYYDNKVFLLQLIGH